MFIFLQDRNSLVYCDAVLIETLRLSSLAALTGAHINKVDAKIKGYTIPK